MWVEVDLISGSIKAYLSPQPKGNEPDLGALQASEQVLEVGKQLTVPPKAYHQYITGNQDTTVRVTLSPGDADFERLLMIMNGLGEDGRLEAFG